MSMRTGQTAQYLHAVQGMLSEMFRYASRALPSVARSASVSGLKSVKVPMFSFSTSIVVMPLRTVRTFGSDPA